MGMPLCDVALVLYSSNNFLVLTNCFFLEGLYFLMGYFFMGGLIFLQFRFVFFIGKLSHQNVI